MIKVIEHNKFYDITIKEINILYLNFKYNNISLNTYSIYQYRSKIVNEYLGETNLKDININTLKRFYNFLKYEKKWDNVDKPSNKMINNVYSYLLLILDFYKKQKFIIAKKDIEFKYKQLLRFEAKKAVNIMNSILYE